MLRSFRLLLCASVLFANSAQAQGYGIRIDRVTSDIGMVVSNFDTLDLTGYSTYRLWVTTAFAEDKVVSITGEGDHPGDVSTTGDFFQAALGGITPVTISPALVDFAPSIAYDSWLTIGLDGPVNTAAGEQGTGDLGPVVAPALVVDLGRTAEFTPDNKRDILFETAVG